MLGNPGDAIALFIHGLQPLCRQYFTKQRLSNFKECLGRDLSDKADVNDVVSGVESLSLFYFILSLCFLIILFVSLVLCNV
jgi:hypothetical protein